MCGYCFCQSLSRDPSYGWQASAFESQQLRAQDLKSANQCLICYLLLKPSLPNSSATIATMGIIFSEV